MSTTYIQVYIDYIKILTPMLDWIAGIAVPLDGRTTIIGFYDGVVKVLDNETKEVLNERGQMRRERERERVQRVYYRF